MAYNNNNKKSFSLDNYETVKSRKVRLRNDFKDSLILPLPMSDLNYAGNYILMGALIWKDKKTFEQLDASAHERLAQISQTATPQNAGIALASIALITKADGAGYSLSIAGGAKADKHAWVENAEESAVGRALDNMGYHSGSASQEEMVKVEHMMQAQQTRVQLENQVNSMYSSLVQQGHNTQYLGQIISQTVRPFAQLNELAPDELEKLLNALQSAGNQGAYSASQQQAQQNPQAAPNFVPGAPSPATMR
ncbi:hypothetical protein C2I27_03555 [Priestia megaterium]|uniref:hypothetical protein n=1 Tax=Priestia megaterium TaxID=1404 RepID=UPI000D50D29B|nr:hypothetical protein [Priestia megaterium]PVC74975.1 hypothetical protein C2I27_03555 [Priestia megaterium]